MANHPNRGDIYKQHQSAFAQVSAFVVTKGGERVATVAFKYPRDGAGRLYAYVHWLGIEMVRGHAGGYGYSKTNAAASVAGHKLDNLSSATDAQPDYLAFKRALLPDDGHSWDRHLRDAGFEVWQVV